VSVFEDVTVKEVILVGMIMDHNCLLKRRFLSKRASYIPSNDIVRMSSKSRSVSPFEGKVVRLR
jgi:hypothetical protein